MAQRPRFVEPEVSEALVRDDRALPLSPFAQHSRPIDVEFPAANVRRDIAHGMDAVPDGMVIVTQTQPVLVVDQHLWNTELAYLQVATAPARARVIFVVNREESLSSGSTPELGAMPPTGGVPGAHAPTHEVGGNDLVDIKQLDGYSEDPFTFLRGDRAFTPLTPLAPLAHAPSHSQGGSDPVNVANLTGFPGGTTQFLRADKTFAAPPTGGGAPAAHQATHRAGGSDPLPVTALAGYPGGTANFLRADGAFAAPPTGGIPSAHAATHQPGGSDPMAVDAAAATGSLRTLGTGANQAAPGNDARFTAPSPPTAHATTHNAGGSDQITALTSFVQVYGQYGNLILVDTFGGVNLKAWRLLQYQDGILWLEPLQDDLNTAQSGRMSFGRQGNIKTPGEIEAREVKLLGSTNAVMTFLLTGGTPDQRRWRIIEGTDGILKFQPMTDAQAVQIDAFAVARNGAALFGGSVYERGRIGAMGDWIAFTPQLSGGGWTMDAGDDQGCAYMRVGRTLWMNINLAATSVAAGGTELYITLPEAGMLTLRQARLPIQWSEGGATQGSLGWCLSLAGDWYVHLTKINYAPWNVTVNGTEMHFVFCVELQT